MEIKTEGINIVLAQFSHPLNDFLLFHNLLDKNLYNADFISSSHNYYNTDTEASIDSSEFKFLDIEPQSMIQLFNDSE
jgi:hypothetical protein